MCAISMNANDEGLRTYPDSIHQVIEWVQETLNGSATPGASLAILVDGIPVLSSGVGFRNLDHSITLDENAHFYIYSVTKTLIALVILQLAEEGRVGLDTPVQSYLPHIPIQVPLTVRQSLNHTGGIPDYGSLPAYFESVKADPTHPWKDDDFLKATLSHGLIFAPGEGWQYSNVGYLLLRQVVETVLDTSLAAAMHQRIFARLGLKNTSIAQSLEDAQQLTPGYSSFFSAGHSLHDIRSVYHPGWISHGVAISTASELAQIVEAIFAGPLLKPISRASMLDAQRVNIKHPFFQTPAYGLGVMIDQGSQVGVIAGHGGGGPGYSAGVLHFPAVKGHRITSAALCNCDRDELGLKIAFHAGMMISTRLE
jgi:D-alanyl-D-alanine carboxypeptidase